MTSRVRACWRCSGDSVTTDHISPAGSIAADGPAGHYLIANGVPPKDFNSYGARRGNHEVMVRGTFANIRLKNLLVPGVEGGVTAHLPDGAVTTIFEASEQYQKDGVPLIVIAGKEYGSGSSRDWAAKGTLLLGVRAVIAESFERIHRSNLVGMGVLALEFVNGQNRESLGLTGRESYAIAGLAAGLKPRQTIEGARRGKRQRQGVRGARANRYAGGRRVHPARRSAAVRAAGVAARVNARTAAMRAILNRVRAAIVVLAMMVFALFGSNAYAQSAGGRSPIDPRFVGVWEAVIPSPQGGVLHMRAQDNADGTFLTTFPGTMLPPIYGLISANNGSWVVMTPTGSDGGTYTFIDANQVTMVGRNGPPVTWHHPGS